MFAHFVLLTWEAEEEVTWRTNLRKSSAVLYIEGRRDPDFSHASASSAAADPPTSTCDGVEGQHISTVLSDIIDSHHIFYMRNSNSKYPAQLHC